MRSADTMARRCPPVTTASTSSGTGSRPKRATNRAARSIRNGSSPKLISAVSGVRRTRPARSAAPPCGSTSAGPAERPVTSSAIALIVKSRRARSSSMADEKVTAGLRESSWYTSDAERGDLVAADGAVGTGPGGTDGAERLALGPHGVGPPGDRPADLGRPGVGGEVEVRSGGVGPDEQVANGAADQVQPVSGGVEALGERGQLGQHGGETFGDHPREARTAHAETAPTSHDGRSEPRSGHPRSRYREPG